MYRRDSILLSKTTPPPQKSVMIEEQINLALYPDPSGIGFVHDSVAFPTARIKYVMLKFLSQEAQKEHEGAKVSHGKGWGV